MVKKYFLRANTAEGDVNLIYENLKGISEIIVIKGRSRTAKNRLLTRIAFILSERGKLVEGIMCPFDIGVYEGIIIREDRLAIIDESCAKGLKGSEKNLDECFCSKPEITDLEEELIRQKAKWAFENLYKTYADAKTIHDEWEKIYIDNMDFSRIDSYTKGIISQLIKGKHNVLEGQRSTGFFGASTPDGSVNYIEGLTEDIKNRYYIKGRPGTGKSTFLKKLAFAAEKNGYDTEVYYCSFDRKSLDMVIIRDLSVAVFDSTAPHEVFPSRSGDGLLDFYTESGLFGTDEKYSKELKRIADRYSNKVKQGLAYLRLGCCFESELEMYYEGIIDYGAVSVLADKIIRAVS
ncbi:MAG: hypothetical protein E7417_06145 [Ruminococcaceae bacterium]|nr:hypothetical protein [Oscillospiraceae bacterium]